MYVIDGKVYCDECMNDVFRVDVPDCENYYECDSNCECCKVYKHYLKTKED